MSYIEIFLIALALAMDCFTVSIANGISMGRLVRNVILKSALLFGLFQGGMTLIGWGVSFSFASYIKNFDHWIAFVILLLLGSKMIIDSLRGGDEDEAPASLGLRTLLVMAVATSIDAMAVGVSMAFVGSMTFMHVLAACGIIGLVSFLMTILGFFSGVCFSKIKFMRMEILGGLILIGIGVKILVEHMSEGM